MLRRAPAGKPSSSSGASGVAGGPFSGALSLSSGGVALVLLSISLSTAGAESAPGRGLPRDGRACPTPIELVATAARRKRIKVMLSQVDGLLSFASLVLVREDRILVAVMAQIPLPERVICTGYACRRKH